MTTLKNIYWYLLVLPATLLAKIFNIIFILFLVFAVLTFIF